MASLDDSELRPLWEWPDDREEWQRILRQTPVWRRPRLWVLRWFWRSVHALAWGMVFRRFVRAQLLDIDGEGVEDLAAPLVHTRVTKRGRKRHRRSR